MDHFISLEKLEAIEAIKGGFLSSIQTNHFTIAYTNMKPGVEIPLHHHPEEAVDIILEGELEMLIHDKTEKLTRGMISIVPPNFPHKAKAITECKVVSILFPKKYL